MKFFSELRSLLKTITIKRSYNKKRVKVAKLRGNIKKIKCDLRQYYKSIVQFKIHRKGGILPFPFFNNFIKNGRSPISLKRGFNIAVSLREIIANFSSKPYSYHSTRFIIKKLNCKLEPSFDIRQGGVTAKRKRRAKRSKGEMNYFVCTSKRRKFLAFKFIKKATLANNRSKRRYFFNLIFSEYLLTI
jgi:hypothetical protein